MSIATIPLIQTRIAAATPESPIAIFKLPRRQPGSLEAAFGSTVETLRLVAKGDPLFVGYFHNRMDPDLVSATLTGAANG